MIEGLHPVLQALLGTIFTWALTAIGSGLVFVLRGHERRFLDSSLGFAAGVMMAASFWSLLEPSIEHARLSGLYGAEGEFSFVPAVVGFLIGAAFVLATDKLIPGNISHAWNQPDDKDPELPLSRMLSADMRDREALLRRRGTPNIAEEEVEESPRSRGRGPDLGTVGSWKRLLLLIIAITVHNIPEGLAVGVAFGSLGKTQASTFVKARNLALGIGIQNFPEGMAVSIPLRASGMSPVMSFWYGQLSGLVEPVFGVLGALGVMVVTPLLPYVLSFAAGAMMFVVFDDIIPESQIKGNGRLATLWALIGFSLMMTLDVALS